MPQVCIRIYLNSVLRYKCLILNTHHPDTLYLCEQGCEDSWLFFEVERDPRAEKLGNTFIRNEAVHRNTDYPDWCFSWFCSVPECNGVIISQIRPRSFPFTFLPVRQESSYHRRCVILHSDGIVDESSSQSSQPSISTHKHLTTCEMFKRVYREGVLKKFIFWHMYLSYTGHVRTPITTKLSILMLHAFRCWTSH